MANGLDDLMRLLDKSRGVDKLADDLKGDPIPGLGEEVEEEEVVREPAIEQAPVIPEFKPIKEDSMDNMDASEPVNKINQTRTTGRSAGQNITNAAGVDTAEKKEKSIEELLEEQRKINKERERRAQIGDLLGTVGQALAKYGASRGAAKAMAASRSKLDVPELKFDPLNLTQQARAVGDKDITRLVDMAKQKRYEEAMAGKQKSLEKYREDELKLRERGMEAAAEERKSRREEREEARKARKEDKDLNRKLREERQTDRLKEQDRKQVERYTKMLQGSDDFKDAQKVVKKAGTIRKLLSDARLKGGQSVAMLGPQVARGIAGEVGVMTDKDVTRYVKNPTLVGGLKDSLLKLTTGRISEVSADNLNRLLDIMEAKAKDERNEVIDRTSKQLVKNSNMSYEDARSSIDPNYQGSIQDEFVTLEAPNGERKKVRKDAAQKYLDKGAKVVE